jgi:hypothetical protein
MYYFKPEFILLTFECIFFWVQTFECIFFFGYNIWVYFKYEDVSNIIKISNNFFFVIIGNKNEICAYNLLLYCMIFFTNFVLLDKEWIFVVDQILINKEWINQTESSLFW